MEITESLLRWLHVAAGILWIGHLYFFNFANAQFLAALEGDVRKTVMLGLQPRALYWFRWGAAYTWISGFLLLGLVYYHGGLMFEAGTEAWSTGAIVMIVVTFLFFSVYDLLARTGLAKNGLLFGGIALALIALLLYLMVEWAHFSFRAYNIHLGALFGTIMAANVWMRIWPAQRKIMTALKEGSAPDPALAPAAALRSRHNTFLSVPLVWTMLNAHTTVPAANHWLYLVGVVVLGWITVWLLYGKASRLGNR
ncbi:MAG: urate hydroxylase PuuD [Ignavibacterium sp.]|jgi:uncharacterized membrane protein